ncbi:hypothetical protein [Streptomyces sp. 891-h]|uniref:hypothetical protein n=1 Tax=Streptomyces sp. 891-h TaxID=2720714 RepID=UPI001FAAC469|nr:hypothetical protein [Streptomyces sp. 891-h]UNZ21367.1 hypothetical protein HC362_34270 [Streptomyces sp. 891-h]
MGGLAVLTSSVGGQPGSGGAEFQAPRARRVRTGEADRNDFGAAFGGLLTFPEPKQAYYAGGTYALLGEHERALGHAMLAIRQYETGLPEDRSYGDEALARVDVVTAHLALGNVDEAVRNLRAVLSIPPEQRISQLGAGLRRVLTAL